MIKGVKVKQLKPIPDERGMVMEILRRDDKEFVKFGQVYLTTVYPGVVKGWHFHKKQFDSFVCIKGMIKLALYDCREKSPTKGEVNEFIIGERKQILVQIPPYVHHGFKGISEEEAIIINTVTEPYNAKEPDEYRVDPHSGEIPYDWGRKDR